MSTTSPAVTIESPDGICTSFKSVHSCVIHVNRIAKYLTGTKGPFNGQVVRFLMDNECTINAGPLEGWRFHPGS